MSTDPQEPTAAVPEETAPKSARPEPGTTEFSVRRTADALKVLLRCPDPGDDVEALLDRIESEIRFLELAAPPSREEIAGCVTEARDDGQDLIDVLLAEGVPPGPSVDGHLEWARDFFVTGFVMDEKTEKIDFWERLRDLSVSADERLATIHQPRKGADGRNIFGQPVFARKPEPARVQYGKNVRCEEEQDGTISIYATIDGRLRWVADTVSVDDVLAVQSDVDMHYGNINHKGAVVINGDICRGATVNAKGDIDVRGVVEQSNVSTGGSLNVNGGITGGEGCQFRVRGTLRSRYVRDADVIVEGDVNVQREILGSEIRSKGVVRVPSGRIVGGCVLAAERIDVGQIGADGTVQTHLGAGVDPELAAQIEAVRTELGEANEKLAKIHKIIALSQQQTSRITADQRNIVGTLEMEALALEERTVQLKRELERFLEKDKKLDKAVINAFKGISSETVLEIHGHRTKLLQPAERGRTVVLQDGEVQQQALRAKRGR
jgi:uncharacterized protein (DUF342 family)